MEHIFGYRRFVAALPVLAVAKMLEAAPATTPRNRGAVAEIYLQI
jgi:hypothetical protein